jgi:branched-chain amino acid aminotransferase
MKIWLNDRICDSQEIDIDADGWPVGSGVFETIRTENGEIFELARHMRRAATAARKFEIKLPGEELIRDAIAALLIAEPHHLGRLRLLFSKEWFVAVHQSYVEIAEPAKLTVIDESRLVDPIAFKTFPYSHRTGLLQLAQRDGFDEIICVNESGEITEGAVSNFLFRIDGNWITTPLSAGVLPGVQRSIVIERCGVTVQSLTRKEMERVDSAIVISSLKIGLAVASIDNRDLIFDDQGHSFLDEIRAQTHAHSVG